MSEQIINAMTLEELVLMLAGEDNMSLPAIPRLKIGKLRFTDGPNGARGAGGLVGGVRAAAFPVGISLGATWNIDLAQEVGVALADEVKQKGAHVLLGPTINIQRVVTNGRNFECISEDPLLVANLAAAYILGLQRCGVAATAKHFLGNESEVDRMSNSSEIDERTMREVYLLPFEVAVKSADVWAIMTAYNQVNGSFTLEDTRLMQSILREEWGYGGATVSNWFGHGSTAPALKAGLDLEMPGPTRHRGDAVRKALEAGDVTLETVRDRVQNVLRLLERTGAIHDLGPHNELSIDRPATRELIRRAGAEGTVLLKNDGVLPLQRDADGHIAVIGPNAKRAQIMGGGSAQFDAHYAISPFEGLCSALGGEDKISYATGCTNHRYEPTLKGEFQVDYYNSADLSGEIAASEIWDGGEIFWFMPKADGKVEAEVFSARLTGHYTAEVTGVHRIGVYAAGYVRVFLDDVLVTDAHANWAQGTTYFLEGCDEVVETASLVAGQRYEVTIEFVHKAPIGFSFSAAHVGIGRPLGSEDIQAAARAAANSDVALVFVGRTSEWDAGGWDLEDIALPGRQNELVAAVAAVNRRTVVVLQTGGPVEMPWVDDVAAIVLAWYPGQEAGNSIPDVIFGDAEPSGRLPQTFPNQLSDTPTHGDDPSVYPGVDGKVAYEEGIFLGYRHYEKEAIRPLFAFGFGLGYSTFEITSFSVDASELEATKQFCVKLVVRNTSERDGKAVVQLYVRDPKASVPRPEKELRGFTKIDVQAGQEKALTMTLSARALAYYDVNVKAWRVEAGRFELLGAFSSDQVVATASLDVADDMVSTAGWL
tara:strand:- start:92864 stop:95329 length:2466 start_codon:yes stop_codon:yes gene_type:complete